MNTERKLLPDEHKRLLNTTGAISALVGIGMLAFRLANQYTHLSDSFFSLFGTITDGLSLVLTGLILLIRPVRIFKKALPIKWITLLLLGVTSANITLGLYNNLIGTQLLDSATDPVWLGSVSTESFNFLLISLAFLSLLYGLPKAGIHLFHLVTFFSFCMLINFIYQVPYFYLAPFLQTDYPILTLGQLGISVIAVLFRSDLGLVRLFTGDKIGNIMLRRIFPWTILVITLQGAIRLFFFKKGTFTFEFGVALAAITFLTVTLIILVNTARYLNRLNDRRETAENALRNLNKSLEAKVKQRTIELILSEEKFHKVFKMSPVGMVISEVPSGNLLEVNDRFIQQTGYTRELVIGKSPVEIGLLSARDVEQTTTVLRHQGSIINYETPYFTQTGEKKMGLLSTEIIVIEEIRYAITTVFDVTERIAFEKKLQEVSQAKEQFLANMSHEIRTPMNAIIGFTGLLENIDMDTEGQRYLTYIKSSGESLLVLINDILDFSKIEAGMMVLETIPFDLRDLLQSIHMMFAIKAAGKGLTLKMEVDPAIPEFLLGDPTRLTQILTNLISNAVKFTEAGSVTVRLNRMDQGSDHTKIEFQIQDTGIGIAMSKQKEIYDRFVQASAETTRDFGGSGLGLTIVKRLVELQNGAMDLKSSLGIGTTFSVTIPYQIGRDIISNKESKKALESKLIPFDRTVNVLLAEDHKLNQILAESVLKKFGCSVTIAVNGAQALELLEINAFDIVLMDIQMPIMDGYTAAKLIRTKLNLELPIIAMTAHVMAGEKEKCMSYGMNDYLSKPFKKEDLYSMLHKYIGKEIPHIQKMA